MKALLIFVATLGVGIRFNLPRNTLAVAAAIATLAYWVSELLLKSGVSTAEAAFVGAFLVAITSEVLARVLKVPAPVLSTPGIIPLVPGSLAYRGVIHLVSGRQMEGLDYGTRVLLTAVSIASGLLLASALSRRVMKPTFTLEGDTPTR